MVPMMDQDLPLTRTDASRAVEATGWRFLLGTLCASVPVPDLARGVIAAKAAVEAAGDDADTHLRVDLRPDRVELSLQTRRAGTVTGRDTELARRISDVLGRLGLEVASARSERYPRPVEMLEIAIDAMDIVAVRPFWKVVLGLADQPDEASDGALVDPAGQLPTIWFQQMDEPRPQRNRIHFDITVADDEAEARVQAALAAGGHMVNDAFAQMFWVLADPEGNECCVCTWTDRDEWEARFGER
jgi:4a-hydroxytetrahydrobiopterin dehydratase